MSGNGNGNGQANDDAEGAPRPTLDEVVAVFVPRDRADRLAVLVAEQLRDENRETFRSVERQITLLQSQIALVAGELQPVRALQRRDGRVDVGDESEGAGLQ
jgi:hypothetical protein